MILNLLKCNLLVVLFLCISYKSFSQETRPVASEFKSSSVYLNYTNSIFNTPIEQYKYVKSHRGIEIYETYRHPTNGYVNQTIFPKSMPMAIIKTNAVNRNIVIYKNYSNSIFNKPIESITIKPSTTSTKTINETTSLKNLPKYDGQGEIDYNE